MQCDCDCVRRRKERKVLLSQHLFCVGSFVLVSSGSRGSLYRIKGIIPFLGDLNKILSTKVN